MKDKNLNSCEWHMKPNIISLLYSLNYCNLPQAHSYRAYLNFLEKIMTFCLPTAFSMLFSQLWMVCQLLSQPYLAYQSPIHPSKLSSKVFFSLFCEAFLDHPYRVGIAWWTLINLDILGDTILLRWLPFPILSLCASCEADFIPEPEGVEHVT